MSKLFCFMGPSGGGKSTIQHSLPIRFLTHYTTRKPREGEIDGYHIAYVIASEYLRLSQSGRLATSTEYAGNYYGAPMVAIEDIEDGIPYHATATKDSIKQFKELLGEENVVVCYIKPPDIETLKDRMLSRGDSEEDINRRISHIFSSAELENESMADYVIVNDDLETAFLEVYNIIQKELRVDDLSWFKERDNT